MDPSIPPRPVGARPAGSTTSISMLDGGGLCHSPLKHPIKPQTWSPGQVVPVQLGAPSWCQCRAAAMGAQQGQGHAGGGDVCQVGSCVPFPSLTPPTPPTVGAL